MAGYWPPGFPFFPPPPPPRSARSPPPPPPSYRQYSPSSSDNNSTSPGGVIAGVAISVGVFLLVLSFACSICQGHRNRRANNATADAAAAAAALAARPSAPRPRPSWENHEQQGLRRNSDHDNDGRSPRASPTENLPSFTYNQSVRHKVAAGSGDEAAACSVCLGAFQVGETVRLLPVCLHLYHVECIDPWLEAHSTCPLCRSGTDPTLHVGLLPPV